jgi:hypothetical protein
MENKEKVIDINPDGTRDDSIKRKWGLIKDVAAKSVMGQLEDPRTLFIIGGVALYQGLKYKGSFKLGAKAGLSTAGVILGVSVANGLIESADEIKRA